MKNIEISFIIPCYNCAKTLDETIQSILNLNLNKYEICMIDDKSRDDTFRIMRKYQKKYPRLVKIGRNSVNVGGGETRNRCFKMTKYPYIFMLDSDNILIKEAFFNLLKEVEEVDDIITFGIIKFFYSKFSKAIKLCYKDLVFLKKEMNFEDLRRTLIHPPVDGNYLYRREVFEKTGGYETDLGAMDTWSFGYKALAKGYRYKIVKNASYLHRVNLNSYWFREIDKNFENLRKLLLRFPVRFSSEEIEEIKKARDVTNFLINQKNNFVREKINFPYGIVLKLYNFIFSK